MRGALGVPGVLGPLSRRELLAVAARWTVPTVATLTLGPSALVAASCPPCYKRSGAVCRACSVSDILNCRCEPCLGAPYCTGASPAPPGASQASPGVRQFPSAPRPGTGVQPPLDPRRPAWELPRQGRGGYDAREPLFSDPFSRERYTSPFRDRTTRERSLYDRLRGDTLETRRIP